MGYTTMGFAAGVLLSVKGGVPCAPAWSFAIAASLVSGTMSFSIVPAMAASESFPAVALLTLGINFRYAFYGRGNITTAPGKKKEWQRPQSKCHRPGDADDPCCV